MSHPATASFRRVAVAGMALAALGCLNLPDLNDPFFRSLAVTARVLGGVSSLHPLPSSSKMELDSALLGTWNEIRDKPATWSFEVAADEEYLLWVVADGDTAAFEGTLHRLGPDVFLQLSASPLSWGLSDTEAIDGEDVGLHAFFRFFVERGAARLEGIDSAWVRRMIESGQLDIEHDPEMQGWIRLIAPGTEIAALLRRFAAEPGVLDVDSGFELRR